MAIKIKFDSNKNPIQPTFVLATKKGRKLGVLPVHDVNVESGLNTYTQVSFYVSKDECVIKGKREIDFWNNIQTFKLCWAREWDAWFEMYVETTEDKKTIKDITLKSLGEAELSQINLYDFEANTEDDIARDDYSKCILYDENNFNSCLLGRVLNKAPHYTVAHVDTSIKNLQRTFKFGEKDIYSALLEIGEELNCLFVFDNGSNEDRSIKREIRVYDLESYCLDCGERGDFGKVCPKCESENVKIGYGKDTNIYFDTKKLAESIKYKVDEGSVKNCFKLEAGDDLMTSAIISCLPNGSNYIWNISEETKNDMSQSLASKLESYDTLYDYYDNTYSLSIPTTLLSNYNSLIDKYGNGDNYSKITSPIIGYKNLTKAYFEAIDLYYYLKNSMMPNSSTQSTSAQIECNKLNSSSLSPIAVTNISNASETTVTNAIISYAKVIVDKRYKVSTESVSYNKQSSIWSGKFIVTNYSDEDDEYKSATFVSITLNEDVKTFVEQKISKTINDSNQVDEDNPTDISSLFKMSLANFKNELNKYSLSCLSNFQKICQSCLDILIQQGIADKDKYEGEEVNLYNTIYTPYYQKYDALSEKIKSLETEISYIDGEYDSDGLIVNHGIETFIEEEKNKIQNLLNLENHLGTDLNEFISYKREDVYKNENFISDGLSNDEIFENATQFIEVAKKEIIKSSTSQHTIESNLYNFLLIPEFKNFTNQFELGNYGRMFVDGKLVKMRFIKYSISYDNLKNIKITFSDEINELSTIGKLENVLNKASSMATTYSAITRQAKKGNEINNVVGDWVEKGLSLTQLKIVNNAKTQNIEIDERGIALKSIDDLSGQYERRQMRIINNGIYLTDDNWETVKTGLGKFVSIDPETGQSVERYGLIANTVEGELILGNNLRIYSNDSNAKMTFDEYGLRLTTKAASDGQYTHIFQINKQNSSGVEEPQMFVDSNGDIVINSNVVITGTVDGETTEVKRALGDYVVAVNKVWANTADFGDLWAENATIQSLMASYIKTSELNAKLVDADIIKSHQAKIDTIESNYVSTSTLEAQTARITNLETKTITTDQIDAYSGIFEKLSVGGANIEDVIKKIDGQITVEAGSIKGTKLEALKAKVESLKSEYAEISELNADVIAVGNLTATSAYVETIKSKFAEIDTIVAKAVNVDKLSASEVEALVGEFETVNTDTINSIVGNFEQINAYTINAKNLRVNTLESDYGQFKELSTTKINANEANIGTLNALTGNINTFLTQTMGATNLNAIHLTADNVVIDDAVIKSANIESIDTDIVTIGNDNIILSGSTQQFKDDNGNVRLQIGKDTSGNFTFILKDTSGTGTIIDQDGIKQGAVPNDLIVDRMVASNAGIQASKIKYVDQDGDKTLQTIITQQQGKISNLISETTITEVVEGQTVEKSIKDKYTELSQTVNGISANVGDTSQLGSDTLISKIASIELSTEGISTKVSNLRVGRTNMIMDSLVNQTISSNYEQTFDLEDEIAINDNYVFSIFLGENRELKISKVVKFDSLLDKKIKVTLSSTANGYDIHIKSTDGVIDETIATDVKISDNYVYLGEYDIVDVSGNYIVASDESSIISGALYLYGVQLESGIIPTDWTPSVKEVKGTITEAQQTADKIYWLIDNGSTQTSMTLKDGFINVVSENIDLEGRVKFSSLTSQAKTDIVNNTISNINIGGTNLFINSRSLFGGNYSEKLGTVTYNGSFDDSTLPSKKYCSYTISALHTTGMGGLYFKYNKTLSSLNVLKENEIYTYSFWAKSSIDTTFVRANWAESQTYVKYSDNAITNTWKKYYVTFKYTNTTKFTIAFYVNDICDLYLSSPKLEKGNVVTDWSESSEEIFSKTIDRSQTIYIQATIDTTSVDSPTSWVTQVYTQDNDDTTKPYRVWCTSKPQYDKSFPVLFVATQYEYANGNISCTTPQIEAETIIDGGNIITNTITSSSLNAREIFGNKAVLDQIKTIELNADKITSGHVKADNIELYGLSVKNKTTKLDTFTIDTTGNVQMMGTVRSSNYLSGRYGWAIKDSGDAEFNNIALRGNVNNKDGGITKFNYKGFDVEDATISRSMCKDIYNKAIDYLTEDIYLKGRYTGGGDDIDLEDETTWARPCTQDELEEYSSMLISSKTDFATLIAQENESIAYNDFKNVAKEAARENGIFEQQGDMDLFVTLLKEASYDFYELHEIRFWAGSTLSNIEDAPFKVYNDGTIHATKGIFSGVFSGEIKIGNIEISDPDSQSSDDAILKIKRANSNVDTISLTDGSYSSFRQDLKLFDGNENQTVSINKNGTVEAKIFDVGNNTYISNEGVTINNNQITSSDNKIVSNSDLNVGSLGKPSDLCVYGNTLSKGELKFEKTMMFGDHIKCTADVNGIYFDYIQ